MMRKTKRSKMNTLRLAIKSRTVRFALILAALSALQGFVLAIPIDPLQQALLGFAIAALIIFFRFITKTAI